MKEGRNSATRRRGSGRRQGFALTAVILLTMVLTLFGMGYLSLAVQEHSAANERERSHQAYFLAEAGRQRAIYRLSESANWNNLSKNLYDDEALGQGTYDVRLLDKSRNSVTIEAIGEVGGIRRMIVQDASK